MTFPFHEALGADYQLAFSHMQKAGKFMIMLATAAAASMFFVGVAEAKSVKWYCVALDPATPWIQTCYPSTNRP